MESPDTGLSEAAADMLEQDLRHLFAQVAPRARATFKVDRSGDLRKGLDVHGEITVPLSTVSVKEGT